MLRPFLKLNTGDLLEGTKTVHSHRILCVAMAALGLSVIGVRPAGCEEPGKPDDRQTVPAEATPAPRKPRQAIESAIAFLEKDAAKWREEHGCATCHHGTMTVWALSEAKSQGYPVGAETLADAVQWTKERFVPRFSQPRDARPGWNLVSVPAIYLGVMSQNLPILSRDEINRVAVHLARHQEEDGTWLIPPPGNGGPPIWESQETVALLALLAWEPYVPADPQEEAAVRVSREKTAAWLSDTKSTETAQAIALRLLLEVRTDKSAEQLQSGIDGLLGRQNSDGGWSQVRDVPSDAYATGQTLWVLSFAGVKHDRPEIGRAVSFLVENQREDGSWPMTSRNFARVEAIAYFGSAWATLGLVRSVPTPPDTVAKQRQAFDQIRGYGGKYDVDETSPDRPVVRADLRYYEVDDMELANFTNLLQAFPRLVTLQFKSTKITDAGLAHLKALPQLRSLALENAAITDAGIEHLKALTDLEELDLRGTQVTNVGVQAIQNALPKLNVER